MFKEAAEKYLGKLQESVDFLSAKYKTPRVVFILGSGLDGLSAELTDATEIPYDQIPNFPLPSVEGHPGSLILGTFLGLQVAVLRGRVHLYEGHPAHQVVFPLRVLRKWGAEVLVVTNSAGGLNPEFKTGDLMLINNQIGLFSDDPSEGVYHPELGPRFYDIFEPYDAELNQCARKVSDKLGIALVEGVYCLYRPCSYESKADIKAMRVLGADAVGKSTVPEVLAARQMGMRVLGISCISAQMTVDKFSQPLTHEEVLREGKAASERFNKLICGVAEEFSEMVLEKCDDNCRNKCKSRISTA